LRFNKNDIIQNKNGDFFVVDKVDFPFYEISIKGNRKIGDYDFNRKLLIKEVEKTFKLISPGFSIGQMIVGEMENKEVVIGILSKIETNDNFPFKIHGLTLGLKNCKRVSWIGNIHREATIEEILGVSVLPPLPRFLDIYTEKIVDMIQDQIARIPIFGENDYKNLEKIKELKSLIFYWKNLSTHFL